MGYILGYILLSWDTSCVVGYPCGIHPVICIAVSIDIVLLNNASSSQEIIMKTFQEWWSQDQCNEAQGMDDRRGREIVLRRVLDGLKKGFGTDNIKDLESLSFTGEMLRSPLPRTGEPHQGQGANLDDETIKAARALGILVPGEHGHLKLVAAEDWRVRGSNYERPFGGEDDQADNWEEVESDDGHRELYDDSEWE